MPTIPAPMAAAIAAPIVVGWTTARPIGQAARHVRRGNGPGECAGKGQHECGPPIGGTVNGAGDRQRDPAAASRPDIVPGKGPTRCLAGYGTGRRAGGGRAARPMGRTGGPDRRRDSGGSMSARRGDGPGGYGACWNGA